MGYNADHGFFEASAEHNSSADSINSNRVKILDNSDELDIRISIFFDGTGNNMYNIDAHTENEKRKNGDEYDSGKAWADRLNVVSNDSFESDYSNVARLFTNYKKEENNANIVTAEYVEGIATKKHRPDSPIPAAFGSGLRGIPDKVMDGCEQLGVTIKELVAKKKIKSLTFDVFGFSRGAAAARLFIFEINKPASTKLVSTGSRSFQEIEIPARGALGKAFQKNGVIFEGVIKIQFAGIFDTVPAYKGFAKMALDNVAKAEDVLHLTAMDERRANFALVDVSSKGLQYEKELPGVHSDVGGSYLEKQDEEQKIFYQTSSRSIDKEIEYLLEDSWYKDRSCLTKEVNSVGKYLIGKKTVKNHYSFIPLHIMKKKASEKPNDMMFIERAVNDNYTVPTELEVTEKRLDDYVFKKNIQPMKYYTAREIIAEIRRDLTNEEIDIMLDKIALRLGKPDSSASHKEFIREKIPKEYNQFYEQAFNQYMGDNLNADDFSQYPALQQKIEDHKQLKILRLNYFHTSHKCTQTDELVDYLNPYKTSVRDVPSREIIKDTVYRK